jgi:hypothetical protein
VSPEDMQLTPEQLFGLVEFLVERGHAKAAADVMIGAHRPLVLPTSAELVQRAGEHTEVCR